MLQSSAARYNVWVFGHKGQNVNADGLMSVEAWFGSLLLMFPSQPLRQAWKPYQANKDTPSLAEAVHTPLTTQTALIRRALSSGVLTLNGQRNHHKQLLSYSGRERLTFVQLSLQRHHWHTDNTPKSDSLKEIYQNMQINTFLPFWVCPSSMSSSIVLILFYSSKKCKKKKQFGLLVKPFLF